MRNGQEMSALGYRENARKLKDFIHINGRNVEPEALSTTTQFSCYDRFSEDIKVNTYGRELINLCKSSQMQIMNGYFNNDHSTGQFTCCTPRGTSLIDYLACDFDFFNHINEFKILPLSVDSDHKPLFFLIKLQTELPEMQTAEIVPGPSQSYFRYVYDESKTADFLDSLGTEVCLKFLVLMILQTVY